MVMVTERHGRYHILFLLLHQVLLPFQSNLIQSEQPVTIHSTLYHKVIIIHKYILFCGFRISEHFNGIKFCNFHLTSTLIVICLRPQNFAYLSKLQKKLVPTKISYLKLGRHVNMLIHLLYGTCQYQFNHTALSCFLVCVHLAAPPPQLERWPVLPSGARPPLKHFLPSATTGLKCPTWPAAGDVSLCVGLAQHQLALGNSPKPQSADHWRWAWASLTLVWLPCVYLCACCDYLTFKQCFMNI